MVNPDHSSNVSSSSKASSATTETSSAKTKDSIYSKIRRFHHSKHHHHHVRDDKRASDEQIDIQTIPIEEDEEESPSESPRTDDAGNKSSGGVNLSSPTPANSEIDVNGDPSTTLERLIAMDKEQERRAKELTAIMLNIQKMVEKNERKDPREEDERGLKVPQGHVIHPRTLEFPNARGGIHRMTVNWPENFGPRSFRLRFFSMLTKLLAHSLNYLSMTHLLPCQTEYELYRTIPWTIKPRRPRPSPTVIEPECEDDEGANFSRGRRPPNIKTKSSGAPRTKNS